MATLGKFNYLTDSLKKEKQQQINTQSLSQIHLSLVMATPLLKCFRRVLLSSIEGATISSIKIDGVSTNFKASMELSKMLLT